MLDDLLAEWERANTEHVSTASGSSGNGGRTAATTRGCSSLATTSPTSGSNSSATPRPSDCIALFEAHDRRRSRWCCCPTATVLRGAGERRARRRPRPAHERRVGRSTTWCIVGAGPAGLAAAVYAASEGLRSVDHRARRARAARPGRALGSRTTSGSRTGSAVGSVAPRRRPRRRARRGDGAGPRPSTASSSAAPVHAVRFDDGTEVEARAVLVATGVSYRLLEAPTGSPSFTGRGVYYGADGRATPESTEGDDVYIVGAANSAGQAALQHRAATHERVVMLVRGGLARGRRCRTTWSNGCTRRDNIEVRLRDRGRSRRAVRTTSSALTLVDRTTGDEEERRRPTGCTSFIGALPRTDWLGDRGRPRRARASSSPDRTSPPSTVTVRVGRSPAPPFLLETSVPGVFAAGDVRSASMKRVASAVGEGSSVGEQRAPATWRPSDACSTICGSTSLANGLTDDQLARAFAVDRRSPRIRAGRRTLPRGATGRLHGGSCSTVRSSSSATVRSRRRP